MNPAGAGGRGFPSVRTLSATLLRGFLVVVVPRGKLAAGHVHPEAQTVLAVVVDRLRCCGERKKKKKKRCKKALISIDKSRSSERLSDTQNICDRRIPTDIVVALPLAELLAQGEGGEALELLRELLGRVGGEGPRALPAQLVEGVRLAHVVVLLVHHVEHVALGILRAHLAVGVVRADDVQVVVDANLHRVLVPQEPARGAGEETREEQVTGGCSGFLFFFHL